MIQAISLVVLVVSVFILVYLLIWNWRIEKKKELHFILWNEYLNDKEKIGK